MPVSGGGDLFMNRRSKGSVANFGKGRRKGYRWTHLCSECGELLKCRLVTGWKLMLADHVSHLDAIQRR